MSGHAVEPAPETARVTGTVIEVGDISGYPMAVVRLDSAGDAREAGRFLYTNVNITLSCEPFHPREPAPDRPVLRLAALDDQEGWHPDGPTCQWLVTQGLWLDNHRGDGKLVLSPDGLLRAIVLATDEGCEVVIAPHRKDDE